MKHSGDRDLAAGRKVAGTPSGLTCLQSDGIADCVIPGLLKQWSEFLRRSGYSII